MSQARRAALHLLNNEWSQGVWKHWLSNIFLPPVEPPKPAPPVAERAEATVNTAPPPQVADDKLSSTCHSERPSDVPESTGRDARARRSELRARFDALSDRLGSVEDGLDTLLRRSSQREKLERRSDQLNAEAIDQVAVAAERQAAVLETMLGTVARLEHAVSRLEHGLSRVERAQNERNRRDSHAPSAPPASARASELDEIDANETSSINGFLSEMSLSTVLAMLEIERHTGRLKVATDDGRLASFELAEGSVVSSRLLENDADPLQTLRTALCWKQGRFWFRQQPAEPTSFVPRSIGSLLLEATRQNDESFADVG